MKTIIRALKNYKISVPIAILVLIGGFIAFASGGNEVKRDFMVVSRGTVSQEVIVTGRVKSAEEVDLAVQSGGKVALINAMVGQSVTVGQTLLRVDDADLQIRLGRQQATLEKAKLALAKQEPGAGNATSDLTKAYDDAFNVIVEVFLDLPSLMTGLDDILNDWRHSPYLETEQLRQLSQIAFDTKRNVDRNFFNAKNKYDALLIKYKALDRNASSQELDAMLTETYNVTKTIADTVKATHNLVDYVEDKLDVNQPPEIDTDQTTLDGYTTETSNHLSELLAIKNTIKDSRDAITGETHDTTSSRIDIRQAELDIQDTYVQMAHRTIKAPVSGVVTKVTVEKGETVSSGTAIISIISLTKYEVEADLPEADIAKLQVGAEADITLDAYGNEVIFKARVVSIDPSETLIDGVATYNTTFQFIQNDERIKSGMTASIKVYGEQKENVLAIPQRAIITKDSEKLVQVLVDEQVVEKKVKTGLRGSDGSIEITEGITEGDKVIVFTEK